MDNSVVIASEKRGGRMVQKKKKAAQGHPGDKCKAR